MKRIDLLSFGVGVDSTALLAMHLDRDTSAEALGITRQELDEKFPPFVAAVFSDPGSEWPETYENLAYAEKRCAEVGLPVVTVRHTIPVYHHNDTGEELRYEEWRSLPKSEKDDYTKGEKVYKIYEWLMDGGMLPVIGGQQHTCSMRFKGNVQQKWAEETFGDHTVSEKWWMLGIEANEGGRTDRFTANHGQNKVKGHEYSYPLQELDMNRKECLAMLQILGWDYRGDGSPVQKSSCMWCPFCKEWEVDRLIDADGIGLQEALGIEERFYSEDKHEKWHRDGMPLNKGGRCNRGYHRTPMASGWCEDPNCTHVYKMTPEPDKKSGLSGYKKEFKPYTEKIGAWKLMPFQWLKLAESPEGNEIVPHPVTGEMMKRKDWYERKPVANLGKATLNSLKYDGLRYSMKEHIARRNDALLEKEMQKILE